MRRLLLLVALLLVGCESDEAKLRRLESARATASLEMRILEQSLEDAQEEARRYYLAESPDLVAARERADAKVDSIRATIPEVRRRLTLAERDLNRFLYR